MEQENLDAWHKARGIPRGARYEESQRYSKANKEVLKIKARAAYVANREEFRAKAAAYRKANPERVQAQRNAYVEANREKIRAKAKIARANWTPEQRAASIAKKSKHYQAHKPQVAEYKRKWATENHARLRDNYLQNKYGIGLVEYQELMDKQDGACAICLRKPNGTHRLGLMLDHDHISGRVRGLLCGSCNLAIGKLRDDPNIVASALRYLTPQDGVGGPTS